MPSVIYNASTWWRSELPLLADKHILRCYFKKESYITLLELHRFCDASELAYGAVVYLRMTDTNGDVQISLVTFKTKGAPIEHLTIPLFILCAAKGPILSLYVSVTVFLFSAFLLSSKKSC